MRKGALGPWLMLAAYASVVLGPVLVLLIITVRALMGGHLGWLYLAIPTGRRLGLYLNSIGLALGVSITAMALGWLGAVLLWSWRGQAAGLLMWLILPLIALPRYMHAMAWLAVADAVGDLLRPFGWSMGFLQGWGGTLWVEVAAFSPLALGCAWIGLRSIDPELVEAGRIARSDVQNLLRIALPLSAPSLLTGAGIVFLLSLLDYSVPSLFQVHVYAMEVFAEFSATNGPERTFLLAMPLLLLAVGVLAAVLGPLRTLTLRAVLHRDVWTNPPQWPTWIVWLQWMAGILVVVQALAPFVVLISQSGVLREVAATMAEARSEVTYSLWTSGLAALLSLPLALVAARALLRADRFSHVRWMLVVSPLAVPAPLVGIGLIIVSNRPSLEASGVAQIMPAVASMARFTALAALILLAQMRRTDMLLLDAALVFQPAWWRRQFRVRLPLLAGGLLAGAGLVFALSMGELGATLMVVPPGQATLTMRIYNYLHYGASDMVAALCLILATGVLLAGTGAAGAAALWSRLFAGPEVRS